MRHLFLALFGALFVVTTTVQANPVAGAFGRYVGVLKHAGIAQDQLARLDFVTENEVGGVLKLRATLVLFFGGFDSHEYASFDYDNVSFHLLQQTLVFDSAERELNFVVQNFAAGQLTATLQTGGGDVGTLVLSQAGSVTPERPLVQPLWGEYRGICEGVGQRLQIQSLLSRPGTTSRTDPFAPYEIVAQLGDNGGSGCDSSAGTCISAIYQDADYDFFKGHVDFHGRQGPLTCDVDATGLTCGSCRYERTSNDFVALGGEQILPQSQPQWQLPENFGETSATVDSLQGQYSGFLHLEQRNLYQPMSVAVTTYRAPGTEGDSALIVSLSSTLQFGGHTATDQAITTKFDPKPWSILRGLPVFDRVDHGTDTILKMTKFGPQGIEGEWFSRRYGRVGTFVLTKTSKITLLQPQLLAPAVNGVFDGDFSKLMLQIALSDSSMTSEDPFSPLTLHGWYSFNALGNRIQVTDGGYDPFTGKFSLGLGSAGYIVGLRRSGEVTMKRVSQVFLSPMQPHKMLRLREESP